MIDETLADEALFLADGSDVHDIAALVGTYRKLDGPAEIQQEFERELRAFVARKRLGRADFSPPAPAKPPVESRSWLERLLSYFRNRP
jgi:hypothetical protein